MQPLHQRRRQSSVRNFAALCLALQSGSPCWKPYTRHLRSVLNRSGKLPLTRLGGHAAIFDSSLKVRDMLVALAK
jgi:hypothetical protein